MLTLCKALEGLTHADFDSVSGFTVEEITSAYDILIKQIRNIEGGFISVEDF